jgi:malic enzyme
VAAGQRVGLLDAIKMASPTMLLGTSTVHGAFTREVIEAMAASAERPLIFPISNPTPLMEAMPADVLAWSNGKALVATGSPIDPVTYNGITHTIGQANNAFVFPGIGLGVVVAGAQRVTKGMLDASAKAVARQSQPHPVPRCCPTSRICARCRQSSPRRSTTLRWRTGSPPRSPTTSCKPSSAPCGCPNTRNHVSRNSPGVEKGDYRADAAMVVGRLG